MTLTSTPVTSARDTSGDGPVEPEGDPIPGEEKQPGAGTLALRTLLGLAALFGIMAVLASTLKAPLESISVEFFNKYGLLGMFIGTTLSDSLGIPIPVDTYLMAAVTANSPTLPVLTVACAASILGGNLAWLIGRRLDRFPLLGRLVERFKARGQAAFARWGVAAVAVAAWTPIPFSIICMAAGAFAMPFRSFFLTTLHRIPRIVLYYYVIALGWSVGDMG